MAGESAGPGSAGRSRPVPFGRHPIVWGAIGAYGLTAVFYLIQRLSMGSWTAPLDFLAMRWYLVLPLVVGFGLQVGLFQAIRLKAARGGATTLAVSGGLSTSAMVACCLHNLVFLLPFVGLAGAAAFLAGHQVAVLGVSVAFMLGGVAYMWRKYRRLALVRVGTGQD